MQQIADWLEKLGMSEYAQRFAENDIDASVLPHLTDQSLKELGVSLGPLYLGTDLFSLGAVTANDSDLCTLCDEAMDDAPPNA